MSSGSKVLVIGYGNTLRRDDGVGPFVTDHLEPSPGLHVITSHQLTPELAEPVSQADLVVFVDARADLAAGEIVMEPLPPRGSTLIHRLDPGTLLQWSLKLYGRVPEAILIGIGAASFDLGEGLSPEVEQAAVKALRAIRKLLHDRASQS